MKHLSSVFVASAVFAFAFPVLADTTTGSNVLVTQSQVVSALPGGGTATHAIQAGPADSPEGDIFHGAIFHCTGSVIAPAEGDVANRGICLTVHESGDLSWLWFSGGGDGGNWGFLDGTGSLAGIEGSGTYSGPATAAGIAPGSYEGTYEIE